MRDDETIIAGYRQEALSISGACLMAAENHYAAETPWFYAQNALTWSSAGLSALTGAAIISSAGYYIPGILSILAALAAALSPVLDPSRRANLHHTAAKTYEALYHEAGYFARIILNERGLNLVNSQDQLHLIAVKFSQLNASCPPIPRRAVRIAKQLLETGDGEVVREAE